MDIRVYDIPGYEGNYVISDDYAALTRPTPSAALPQIPAQIGGYAHPGPEPMTAWTYAATAPPRRPGRHKIPDVVQLATPRKRPVPGLYRPCNSGIIRRPCLDGTRKPTQADNIAR